MDATLTLLVAFLGFLAVAVGRPQDSGLSFPDDSDNESGNRQGVRPPQGNFQGFPLFPLPNQTPSSPRQTQRPTQRPLSRQTTTTTSTNTGSETTTRIPPRDPANRIVYTVPNCNCPFTFQYNPVCGTDGQTYGNMGVIDCAMRCGSQVQVYLVGACGRNNG